MSKNLKNHPNNLQFLLPLYMKMAEILFLSKMKQKQTYSELIVSSSLTHPIVENYSEIDWFDFEMRMRRLVHNLMEPTIRQATDDRSVV